METNMLLLVQSVRSLLATMVLKLTSVQMLHWKMTFVDVT